MRVHKIISLFAVPRKTAYLVDVHLLGSDAFTITNNKNNSIKTVLESPSIPKVFFDVRNSSDALFNLYNISLSGVEDLQLMELAYRPGPNSSKKYLADLATCVEQSSLLLDAQKREWERGSKKKARMFDYQQILDARPLREEIEQYCVQDVTVLPGLYKTYDNKLRRPGERFWQVEAQHAAKKRIKLSQAPQCNGQDKNNMLGPWSKSEIEQAIEDWNEDVMFEAMHGDAAPDWEKELEDFFDLEEDHDDDDGYDNYQDTARDCIGWEEDMMKNGELF